jgi:hypothetical protein
MGMKRLLGALIVLSSSVCAGAEAGRVFYVDSKQGDDASRGDRAELAWRSLERVNRAELRPGDTVRFRRGGVWRGTLVPVSGADGRPIAYGAYGEGRKPLLLGSVPRHEATDWVRTGEQIWATRKPVWTPKHRIADLRRSDWRCHREHDARITARMQDAETGRHLTVVCQASGSRINYIQAWGPSVEWKAVGSFPAMLFRFRARSSKPFRMGAIRVTRSGPPWTAYAAGPAEGPKVETEWRRFEVRLPIHSRGEKAHLHLSLGGRLPANATFEIAPLELVALECPRDVPLDVDVGNIIFDHGRPCGWKRWRLADVKRPYDYFYDGEQQRVYVCLARNPGEAHDSVELALRRHIVDQGGKHDIVYEDLALRYGAAHGFGGHNTARLVIRHCDLSYIGGGHQHTRKDGRPVRYGNAIEFWNGCRDNLVEGCRIWQVYDAALTNQGRGPESVQENITYRNNIIHNCEYSFEYWNGPETARTRNIRFVHNTCVDAGVVWSHAQRPDPNGSHLMFYTNSADTRGIEIKYNVFYNSTEWGSRYSAGWNPLPDMDQNVWYVPTGELCFFFKEHIGRDDVAGYREKTGLDARSLFGDPKLVDPENGDFRLSPDTPVTIRSPDGKPVGASH